jgi:hypothetical protein
MNCPAWILTIAACCLLLVGCSSESNTGNDSPADATTDGQAAATDADEAAQADGSELLVPPSNELAGEPEPEEERPEPIARPSLLLQILTDPLNDAIDAQIELLPGPARIFIPSTGRSREDRSEEPPPQGENEESEEASEPAGQSVP